jgi:hypothetical protein
MKNFLESMKQKVLERKKKAAIQEFKKRGTKYSGSTGKSVITGNETLTLSTKTNELIKQVKEEVNNIHKETKNDPENLLKYIEEQGTKVYRVHNASKILEQVKEHTGFITSLEGGKALYINTITGEMGLKTKPMFIINDDTEIDYYLLLREFYLWYSMQKGLDGFDYKTQELFKKNFRSKGTSGMENLKFEEMGALKEAISRDSEANEFVMEILRHTEGGANVMKKMQEGGADI